MSESTTSPSSAQHNSIYRFTFAEHDVRGELVQLNSSYAALCDKHHYPAPVAKLLGELLAVTSLLTATLKFEGHINVQVQGSGPLNFATVNGRHDQKLRGLARTRAELTDDSLLGMLGDDALLILTLTPEQGERYQGMVKIEGNSLAKALETYFDQSEQLSTRIWLHADPERHQAAGFMLQVLPVAQNAPSTAKEKQQESFEHFTTLASTLTQEEIFTLPVEDILHRLFHEDDIRLYPEQEVAFYCGCSRERTANALRSVERSELREILETEGRLVLSCDYCLTEYSYDAIDVEALDSPEAPTQTQ
ncbi:Hsp33 family molecular chaperone HslO [Aliidiomarina taiwanensis]|uniref:33 kDa chaperonin n=1 Tax=Aliidiomarina taiwanensis TaxID=946228 RepID=A0A432X7X7_9GAMM|nr:Hsp33 family molecular chaperone HslO [Aliidiomarina taiwanensis]RUO42981.1 Hsp33 family molecular chaperone HslO [Aliidiomarina taiwanensis]